MATNASIYFESFPTRPRKGDLRRLEILQTTIHCVAREGYAGSTFDRVAKELKTRRSHIAYYFKTREDLLLGALQLVTTVAQKITIEHVTNAKTTIDKIVAISDGAYAWSELHPEQSKFILLFYFMCTYEPSFKKLHTEIREAGYQRLRALLVDIVGPRLKVDDIDRLAKSMQGMLTGLLIEQATTTRTKQWDFRKLTEFACHNWIESLL